MGQRQVGEELLVFVQPHLRHRAAGGEGEGPGALHHALGLARGAGGIEDAEQILRALHMPVAQRLVGGQQFVPFVLRAQGRVRHGDADDLGGNAGLELPGLVELAEDDRLARRVAQHVVDALHRLQRVQRHADQPREHDRQVADDPLGAVLRQDRHPVAGHAAQHPQGAGQAPGLVVGLAPGQVMPLALHRLAEPDAVRRGGHPWASRCNGSWSVIFQPSLLFL